MALKTRKPVFSQNDSDEKINQLISYVEALSEEIEFKLDQLSRIVEQIKRVNG